MRMESEPLPGSADSERVRVEDLSASFAELSQQPSWQVEVPDALSDTGATQDRAAATPPPLWRILEALLFVGGDALTAERARAAIRGLTPRQFTEAIASLNRDYRRQGRPYAIRAHDQGYVLTLRPRFKEVADKLYGQTREARLSPPAIDVLSLVAYRQPVTKQEVDSLRGAESGALLRQLVRRGLVAIVQRGESGHRQVFFGTTTRFLELFKLTSLEDLPQTQDLERL
jgi:segregation and condensation protein B